MLRLSQQLSSLSAFSRCEKAIGLMAGSIGMSVSFVDRALARIYGMGEAKVARIKLKIAGTSHSVRMSVSLPYSATDADVEAAAQHGIKMQTKVAFHGGIGTRVVSTEIGGVSATIALASMVMIAQGDADQAMEMMDASSAQ